MCCENTISHRALTIMGWDSLIDFYGFHGMIMVPTPLARSNEIQTVPIARVMWGFYGLVGISNV